MWPFLLLAHTAVGGGSELATLQDETDPMSIASDQALESTTRIIVNSETVQLTPVGTDLESTMNGLPMCAQMRELFKIRIFRYSALGYALLTYVITALAFQWTRVFMGLWPMGKDMATTSLIVIPGVGGALGLVMSTCWRIGSPAERMRTLRYMVLVQAIEISFAIAVLIAMFIQAQLRRQREHEGISVDAWVRCFHR